MRAAAEDVARDLVEQQHERQRPRRGVFPVPELGARGGYVGVEESLAAAHVERGPSTEPDVGTGFAPEGGNIIGGHVHAGTSRRELRRTLASGATPAGKSQPPAGVSPTR